MTDRKTFIGGSDIASICGLSPYKTAFDLWVEKTGKVKIEVEENDAIRAGRLIEPVLVQAAFDHSTGANLEKDKRVFQMMEGVPCAVQLDGVFDMLAPGEDGKAGIEAKTAGQGLNWGEPGTDEVPDAYLVQATWQIMVAGLRKVIMPALLGGRGGFRMPMYYVNPNPRLQEVLFLRVQAFWACVQRDEPPPLAECSPEVAKAILRKPGKVASVPPGIMLEWREAVEARKEAEKREADALAELMGAGNDAEILDAGPAGSLTIVKSVRKGYTVKDAEVMRKVYKA